MRAVVLLLAFVLSTAALPVFAQVTVCNGDNCIRVEGNVSRSLSNSEVRSHQQSLQRDRIDGLECAFASNADKCAELTKALRELLQ
ncbi:MAG: hypothetical protein IOC52_12595 [Methylobacterium sp.]|jgi:hypothetical protein|nr:hypothetical protein [Methylobacterium sp.]MCA3625000.1 hypothetical protein [Methylobacterium sp.]